MHDAMVLQRAEAILRALPPSIPNDLGTSRALLLAAVAALHEAGVTRDTVRALAVGDWDAVDTALQGKEGLSPLSPAPTHVH